MKRLNYKLKNPVILYNAETKDAVDILEWLCWQNTPWGTILIFVTAKSEEFVVMGYDSSISYNKRNNKTRDLGAVLFRKRKNERGVAGITGPLHRFQRDELFCFIPDEALKNEYNSSKLCNNNFSVDTGMAMGLLKYLAPKKDYPEIFQN